MQIHDTVYGAFEITSPVILELLASKPLQRAKGLRQAGVPSAFYPAREYSRYDHCVGVMRILQILGASEEEQIAGLLHDVSHTAFSHVVDWLFQSEQSEDFQDNHHEQFLRASEIPSILARHGHTIERMCEYHHFELLERDSPDICADRFDYLLREFDAAEIEMSVGHIVAHENRMTFSNKESAQLFARKALFVGQHRFGGFENATRYHYFAEALKIALDVGIISKEDFWQEDEFITQKLVVMDNERVQHILSMLRNPSLEDLPKSDIVRFNKLRFVDPLYLENGVLCRLSENDSEFQEMVIKAKEENKVGVRLALI